MSDLDAENPRPRSILNSECAGDNTFLAGDTAVLVEGETALLVVGETARPRSILISPHSL